MKPYIVIFSSSASLAIAEGLHAHLREHFVTHLWKGEFFGENKTTPLWTFFKKLFHYDYTILILANDSIILDPAQAGRHTWIPKDNVLFELGATMARLGPQKTILLVPDEPPIHLPGYFDDVQPFIFRYRNLKGSTLEEKMAATAGAAEGIRELLSGLSYESFHSELPAQGLAHAYLLNFVFPLMKSGMAQELQGGKGLVPWSPESGISLNIVLPDQIMSRSQVNAFFDRQIDFVNTTFRATDGRGLGIYILPREWPADPMHVFDIPTTLLTAENIITRIEAFWREKDKDKVPEPDRSFIADLQHREIVNFRRSLEHALQDSGQDIAIITMDQLPARVAQLRER